MRIEDFEDQIQSSVNVIFWNRIADSIAETLNKAKEDGKLEEIKEKLTLLIDGCLEGYDEENLKDNEREAFVRLRDVVKM